MRGTGTEQLVVAVKRLKDRRAKGLRHLVEGVCQPARGGAHEFDKGL